MSRYILSFRLDSEATFGTGRGGAGVDVETNTDPFTGLPRIPGSSLLRLLTEHAASILMSIHVACPRPMYDEYEDASAYLFGRPGADASAEGALQAATWATLPPGVVTWIAAVRDEELLTAEEVRAAATEVRHQTAVSPRTGAPEPGTLRGFRRVLRETPFELVLDAPGHLDGPAGQLLAASAALTHRAGLGRHRGAGAFSGFTCMRARSQVPEEGASNAPPDDLFPLWREAFVERLLHVGST